MSRSAIERNGSTRRTTRLRVGRLRDLTNRNRVTEVTRVSGGSRCDGIEIVNYFSAGKEIGREVIDETGKPLVMSGTIPDGRVAEYYWNGTLKREFAYAGNRPHGLCRGYYPGTRLLWVEQYFDSGLLEGPSRTLYRNGKAWEECTYRAGRLSGEYRSYHENGSVHTVAHYEDGLLEGEYRSYSQYGMPREAGTFRAGKWEGFRTTYSETGEVIWTDTFQDGRMVLRQKLGDGGEVTLEQDEPIPDIEEERAREAENALNEGIEFSNMGCHYKAIQAFRKAIQTKQDFVEAYFKLAFAYRSQGLYHEYMETLGKVLEFDPDQPSACFHAAIAHIITGNRAEALLEYEILKGLDEKYAEGLAHILEA